MLTGALVASRSGDRAEAGNFLREAALAADHLDGDGNDRRTAFGPGNVAIHRVTVAVDLAQPGEALRAASEVNPKALPGGFLERRATLFVEIARARALRRERAEAVASLIEAERVAPEEVRYNAMVHELVRSMLRTERRRHATPSLASLAHRLGVLH